MKNKIQALEKEKEELRNAIAEAEAPFHKRLREIDQLLYAERLNQVEKFVGKCFVYRDNCYSLPKSRSDYWNTYYKICALHRAVNDDDYNYFCILEIEKDRDGRIKIHQFHDYIDFVNNSSRTEISPEEFDKQLNAFLKEITEVSK